MTRDEVFQIDQQHNGMFTLYYGERIFGLWVDIHDDPYYYIVTNNKGWRKENHNRDESVIEKYGRKVHRAGVVQYEEVNPEYYQPSVVSLNQSFNGNVKAKKLVILGAGASYDYDFDDPKKKSEWCPPLGNDLFSKRFTNLIKRFPGVRSSLTELRLEQDVEAFFQSEWNDIVRDYRPERLKDLINIQYYLYCLSKELSAHNQNFESNNYDVLIRNAYRYTRTPNTKAMFVTFNYETLLEQSIERICQTTFNSIDSYVDNSSGLTVIKPHGSCNWGWELYDFPSAIYEDRTIFDTADWLHQNGHDLAQIYFELIRNRDEITMLFDEQENGTGRDPLVPDGHKIYPALLIPFHSKDEFVLPQRHITHFKHHLNQIEDVLVIGWKASEEHFMKLLKNDLARKSLNLTIVDINSEAVKMKLENIMNINTYKSYNTFSEFIRNGGVREFWS